MVLILTFPLLFHCLYSSHVFFFPLLLSCLAVVDDWEDATMFSYLDSRDKTAVMAKRMKYFTNRGKESQVSFCFGFLINAISDLFVSYSVARCLATI